MRLRFTFSMILSVYYSFSGSDCVCYILCTAFIINKIIQLAKAQTLYCRKHAFAARKSQKSGRLTDAAGSLSLSAVVATFWIVLINNRPT